MGRKYSTEQSGEPATRLPPWRYALGLLTPKKDGFTMTMLLARGVKVETIDELLAAGLAIKRSELVGRGRPVEITRIAITDAGRLALERGVAVCVVPDPACLDSLMGRAAIARCRQFLPGR
jgi:hypothetical protein